MNKIVDGPLCPFCEESEKYREQQDAIGTYWECVCCEASLEDDDFVDYQLCQQTV